MAGKESDLTEEMDADGEMDTSKEDKTMSDDSSDSESDANEDAEELRQTEELAGKIQANPYDYQGHLNLIKYLRGTGNLDKLRAAREAMSKIFPLTPELWLDWIKDESQLADTDDEKDHVVKLFERGVKDYLSVALWLEFAQFSIGLMSTESSMEKIREVFERAVTAAGLHVSQGALIWEAYREFELALLATMQPPSEGLMSSEQSEMYVSQRNRVYNIFKRQLSVPLLGMEGTFKELQEWSETSIEPAVEQQYKKAKAKLGKIKEYEDSLLVGEPPALQSYLSYLDFEEKEGDPARIQCLYERAVADHCLVPDLWKRYMTYLDLKLKVEAAVLPCHERSVRNCPWSADLWTSYLKALERFHHPHIKIKEAMEQALQAGFSAGQDYQELWLTYLDYLRRRVDWSKEDSSDVEDLRKAFEGAIDHLGQYYETHGDLYSSVMKYWAQLEAKFCNNIAKSRELWNEITNHGRASNAQTWLDYANFERLYGDDKHLRKVLLKGMYASMDWPETLGDMLIKFEREEGSLETLDVATEKYTAHIGRVMAKRELAAAKEAAKEAQMNEQKKLAKAEKKAEKVAARTKKETEEKEQMETEVAPEHKKPGKRKAGAQEPNLDLDGFKVPVPPSSKSTDQPEEPPHKKAKDDADETSARPHGEHVEHDPAKDEQTVFLSNLLYDAKEEAIKDIFKDTGTIEELRMVRDFKGRFKGFAYLVFSNRMEAEAALKLDRTPIEGRPVFVSKCNKKKEFTFQPGLEKNKLFVKNIPFSMTQEELEELFKKYGDLKEVRLVTYRNGHSKGIAYVEYTNETAATIALVQTDGMQLGKQVLSVAISNPPARGARQSETQRTAQVASLGGGPKETGLRGRGRTQVSLMPRVIQRSTNTQEPKSGSSSKEEAQGLSNADFRHLLLNK
ncbi:squamous cell carcinoma antigen recognized by T-cells 3-like [Ornithodoros turicata]